MPAPLSADPIRPPLTPGWLTGTWEVTATTANIVLPDSTHHHFDRSGRHLVELAFGTTVVVGNSKSNSSIAAANHTVAPSSIFQNVYRAQHDGYWTSFDPTRNPPTSSWFTRFVPCVRSFDEILVTGHSGHLWWIRRMPRPAPYLNFHVDPLTGELRKNEP